MTNKIGYDIIQVTHIDTIDTTNLKGKEVKRMAVQTSMAPSGLAEVLDRILDKGIVIDAWVRVSLLGLEVLTIEARVVIAGVETYLKYAEAVGLTATAA